MATEVVKRVASVFIEDAQAEKSLKQLTAESRKLYNELARLPRGSAEFIAKSKEFQRVQRDLKGVREEVNGTGGAFKKLTGMLGPLGASVAGMFAVDAVIGWGREAVTAFQGAQMAMAKVEQAIISTGGAAGYSLEELKQRSDELQATTLFDGDDILNKATAQLLTFTNIAGEQFTKAQDAALDLATVLDGDLQSSAIMIGKALNDPVKGLTAMGKAGIQFSEDQKTTIQSLVETNRLADAQTIILQELERQYGGQAAAAAEAEGGVTQINRAWGDFQEEVGGAIMSMFDAADGSSLLVDGIRALTDGFQWLVGKVSEARDWFVELYNGSILVRAGIADSLLVIKTAWDAVVLAFKTGYEVIVTPLKAIGQLLTGDFKGAVATVKDGIVSVFTNAKDFAMGVVGNVKDAISEVDDPQLFKPVEDAAKNAKPVVKVGVEMNTEAITEAAALDELTKAINKAADDVRRGRMTAQQRELDDVRRKYDELAEQAKGHTAELARIEQLRGQEISSVRTKYAKAETDRLKKLDEEIQALGDEAAARKLSKEEQEIQAITDRYTKLEEEAKGHADRLAEIERLKDEAIEAKRSEFRLKEQEALQKWEETMQQTRMANVATELQVLDAKHARELEMAEAQGLDMAELLLRQQFERDELVMEQRLAEEEAINDQFEKLYALADEQVFDTAELQRMHGEALTLLKKQHRQADVTDQQAIDAKLLESQRKRAAAEQQVLATSFAVARDLFMAAGADADEMATFDAAMTLFQIGLDTAQAISALTAASEANPLNAVTGGAAGIAQFVAGFARITANIAQASQLLNQPKPTPPAFAVGGGTGDFISGPNISTGGTVPSKTLGWFGELGPEWVAPNWMYSHPTLSPVFDHLEYIRTMGAVPQYATGGRTMVRGTALVNTPQEPGGMSDSAAVLAMLASSVQSLNQQLATGINASISNDLLVENNDRLATIQRESQLTR
jgi:hypothetical protein